MEYVYQEFSRSPNTSIANSNTLFCFASYGCIIYNIILHAVPMEYYTIIYLYSTGICTAQQLYLHIMTPHMALSK